MASRLAALGGMGWLRPLQVPTTPPWSAFEVPAGYTPVECLATLIPCAPAVPLAPHGLPVIHPRPPERFAPLAASRCAVPRRALLQPPPGPPSCSTSGGAFADWATEVLP